MLSERTDFKEAVESLIGEPDEVGPYGFYNVDGDCVEFVVSPCNFYADRVDDLLTLYREFFTDREVGFVIKGIKSMLERPGMRIFVAARVHKLRIKELLVAHLAQRAAPIEGPVEAAIKAISELTKGEIEDCRVDLMPELVEN